MGRMPVDLSRPGAAVRFPITGTMTADGILDGAIVRAVS
jgi:hypothetical protein